MKVIEMNPEQSITLTLSKEEITQLTVAAVMGLAIGCDHVEIVRNIFNATFKNADFDSALKQAKQRARREVSQQMSGG